MSELILGRQFFRYVAANPQLEDLWCIMKKRFVKGWGKPGITRATLIVIIVSLPNKGVE